MLEKVRDVTFLLMLLLVMFFTVRDAIQWRPVSLEPTVSVPMSITEPTKPMTKEQFEEKHVPKLERLPPVPTYKVTRA